MKHYQNVFQITTDIEKENIIQLITTLKQAFAGNRHPPKPLQ
jgi:hypothetical protein